MQRIGSSSLSENLSLALALGLVLAHYLWSASSTANPFRFGDDKRDHYNLLADGLLAGELGFRERPSPELLRLPDPYDPKANEAYRAHHDASLYRGRYYLYFGVVPALTLFVPFRLATGMDLPEGFAAALLMFAGLLLSLASFRLLLTRSRERGRTAFLLVGVFLFGFSDFAPFVLRRPAVYEVAIASGFCFGMAALYFALRGVGGARIRHGAFALASLCLGLAVGSRPHHVFAAPLLAVLYLHAVRRDGKGARAAALGLGLPLVLCLAALLGYNYARFGRFFEFGQSYVLSDANHPRLTLFSPSYVPARLFLYLLAPPVVDLDFPFFHLWPALLPRLTSESVLEAVAGVLPCVPLVALAGLAPLLLWWRARDASDSLSRAVAAALFALALVLVTFVSCSLGVSARYFVDFVPYLLLSAALVWSELDQLCAARRRGRLALHAGLLGLLAYGTVFNLAVGLTGYYDLFRKRNPAGYAAIEDRFLPLQRWLLSRGNGYGDVSMLLRFPSLPNQTAEAVLSVGEREHADVLCVRYEGDGQALFKFHHGADEARRSQPFSLSPGRTRLLEISMGSFYPRVHARVLPLLFPGLRAGDPLRTLSIRLDGQELLEATLDFVPGGGVTTGANAAATSHCPEVFSGVIADVRRAFGGPSSGR